MLYASISTDSAEIHPLYNLPPLALTFIALFDRFLRIAFLSTVAGPTVWAVDQWMPMPIFFPLFLVGTV